MSPRVRFAPAPSGYLHLGSARTALFNWLYARAAGGTFVLRIEDTDPATSRAELIEPLKRSMHWLGLDWDEGPHLQSERRELYSDATRRLVDGGLAYWCSCTPAEVKARTEGAGGYDGRCRDLGLEAGEGRPLRFRVPLGETVVRDVIRGEVRFDHSLLEDFIIVRSSDGRPGFYLANAVDDLDMRITHVVRGEDLLSATPRVLLIRSALGGDDSLVFAHLPLIVDERRRKLSKREHSVAIEEYRDQGYLPEAMRNYLALLGWSPRGEDEVVPIDDMVAQFRIEDVKASAAVFDVGKLQAINAGYIRALPTETFVQESLPWLETDPPWPPERFRLSTFAAVAPLVQERVRTLGEVPAVVDFLFLEEPEVDEASWDKAVARQPAAASLLADAEEEYGSVEWTALALHAATLAIGERHGLKLAKAQAPVRVAVTGRTVGPPLFESLEALGRPVVLGRIRAARERLEGG